MDERRWSFNADEKAEPANVVESILPGSSFLQSGRDRRVLGSRIRGLP